MQPFDAFSIAYKVLILCGYFKLMRPTTRFKYICFQIYRMLVFLLIPLFIAQHLYYFVNKAMDDNIDEALDAFIIVPPELNLLSKYLALNLHSSRVHKLNDLMHDSIFAPRHREDEIILTKYVSDMHRLCKNIYIGMGLCTILYLVSPIFKKLHNSASILASYYPFETTDWGRFMVSLLLESISLPWITNGHVSLDCLIGIYYSQATLQLKFIKNNLEHLFDAYDRSNDNHLRLKHQYIDVVDNTIQERFKHYVERYSKVKWYIQEINHIFSGAIIFQFASTIFISCIIIYKMSYVDVFSVSCVYLACYLMLLQTQILLYCYYGGQVEHESMSVNDSLYMSQWVSASPKFRRQMLIAMTQWSHPVTPRVFAVVPLSLNTFITLLRLSYSLYAGLINTNDIN